MTATIRPQPDARPAPPGGRRVGDPQLPTPLPMNPGEWGGCLWPEELVYFGPTWARDVRRRGLRMVAAARAGRCPLCHRPAPQIAGWRRCPRSSARVGGMRPGPHPDPIEFQLRQGLDGRTYLVYRMQNRR